MKSPTVLVVDDEADVRSVLRDGLTPEGFTVVEAANRAEMMAALDEHPVDLVTLDLALGADDGLELANALRGKINVPVLMITGRGHPFDRVKGLECGADDYIVKPFHVKEVVLRIERILDRYRDAVAADHTVSFDHSNFDLRRRIVRRASGETVPLTAIELQLLDLLVRHPGRVLSRDEISQTLHGRDWAPYDRTIDTHIARLRRKIEPPGDAPSLIRSVRGVGYVFTGDVTSV